ncbi:MAG: glycosyltransferase [Pyrinomonadaceae bacterium]
MDHQSSSSPKLSVIIPAFGRPERLRSLLEELLSQASLMEGIEIIVVDDGSPEPLERSLRSILDDPTVDARIVRQINGGPSIARNQGAATARGEFLLFIDDDLSVPPDLLKCHIAVQEEFGPALLNCELTWQIEADPEPFAVWYRERTAEWGRSRSEDGKPVAECVYEIAAPLASTANLSISRADFERLDGFDAGYPYGCEDQDFAGRADRAGVRILFTTRTTAIHIETHNTLRKLCRRQMLGARDTVRFLKRFAVEHHVGLPDIARYNNPIAWGTDRLNLAAKKSLRRMLTLPGVTALAFGVIRSVEAVAPRSAFLLRAYDVMVGAFVQKGWRQGLRLHRDVEPLDDWKPRPVDSSLASIK